MNDSRQLSPETLSRRWEVSTHTLARWRTEGLGPRFMKIRGKVRYRLEDIESFEHNSIHSSTGYEDFVAAVNSLAPAQHTPSPSRQASTGPGGGRQQGGFPRLRRQARG